MVEADAPPPASQVFVAVSNMFPGLAPGSSVWEAGTWAVVETAMPAELQFPSVTLKLKAWLWCLASFLQLPPFQHIKYQINSLLKQQ